jgi:hypothetical protein
LHNNRFFPFLSLLDRCIQLNRCSSMWEEEQQEQEEEAEDEEEEKASSLT